MQGLNETNIDGLQLNACEVSTNLQQRSEPWFDFRMSAKAIGQLDFFSVYSTLIIL